MILRNQKYKDKLKHFNELVPLIYEDVARYIFSITKNETLTEDVLQNTLIIAYENFSVPEQCILKEELIDHIIKAINELRTEYRQVITLRYYNNLSLDEIATVLNISSSTARVWHMRAKKEVYNWIKDNYLQVDLKKKVLKRSIVYEKR